MLFWAEVFVRLLRACGVPDESIALWVNCHLNNGSPSRSSRLGGWSNSGLHRGCLRAASVNCPSSASRWRRNKFVYGPARLVVHSTFLVQSIYGSIQEYAGFERPEWLV